MSIAVNRLPSPSVCDKIYRNNLKNREFDKEAAQFFASGKARVTPKKMLPSRRRQKPILQVVSVYTQGKNRELR